MLIQQPRAVSDPAYQGRPRPKRTLKTPKMHGTEEKASSGQAIRVSKE